MIRPPHPTRSRQRLRVAGRVGLAFAAGGAFAVFAWEPRPQPGGAADSPRDYEDPYTAERRDTVTEDGASPRLHAPVDKAANPRQWGLVEHASKQGPRAAGDQGPACTAGTTLGGHAPTSIKVAEKTVTTAVGNSRAPPR